MGRPLGERGAFFECEAGNWAEKENKRAPPAEGHRTRNWIPRGLFDRMGATELNFPHPMSFVCPVQLDIGHAKRANDILRVWNQNL